MIKYTQAFSQPDMEKFVRGQHPLSMPLTREYSGNIAWIGIDDHGASLVATTKKPHLVLAFHDIDPAMYLVAGIPQMIFTNAMGAYEARLAIAFIDRIHRKQEPWALLVHCQMGVSRSAAVCEWTRDRLGATMLDELHKHCLPNQHAKRMLDQAFSSGDVADTDETKEE